ncbi:MAG: DUF4258 domain-containing protein [Candidatus Woesearchaeota archaeon]|nr:DUF4258 domain-containing protein [Candidatus Woesearchaeota archaeon]
MQVKLTKHARDRMVERGISGDEVLRAIVRGNKTVQFPNKIVAEYTYFSVVYCVHEECIQIITVKLV